jgi:phage terminase small subunit
MSALPGAQPAGRVSKKKKAAKPAARRKSTAKKASAIIEKLDQSGLTAKESRFVEEYLVDLNATQAAIRAGYSQKTAAQIGYENLRKPHIVDAIAKAMAERSDRTKVTADRVLTGIAELAYYDIAELFADDGSLKAIWEIPIRVRNAIAGIEVEDLWEGRGEAREHIGTLHKVKLADRKGNLELLGRHLKLFTDKVEHEAGASLEQILARSMTQAPKEG